MVRPVTDHDHLALAKRFLSAADHEAEGLESFLQTEDGAFVLQEHSIIERMAAE